MYTSASSQLICQFTLSKPGRGVIRRASCKAFSNQISRKLNSPEKQWVLKSFEGQQGFAWWEKFWMMTQVKWLLTCISHPWGHFLSWSCNTFRCQLGLPAIIIRTSSVTRVRVVSRWYDMSDCLLRQLCDASPWTKMNSWSAGYSKNIPWWLRPEIHQVKYFTKDVLASEGWVHGMSVVHNNRKSSL